MKKKSKIIKKKMIVLVGPDHAGRNKLANAMTSQNGLIVIPTPFRAFDGECSDKTEDKFYSYETVPLNEFNDMRLDNQFLSTNRIEGRNGKNCIIHIGTDINSVIDLINAGEIPVLKVGIDELLSSECPLTAFVKANDITPLYFFLNPSPKYLAENMKADKGDKEYSEMFGSLMQEYRRQEKATLLFVERLKISQKAESSKKRSKKPKEPTLQYVLIDKHDETKITDANNRANKFVGRVLPVQLSDDLLKEFGIPVVKVDEKSAATSVPISVN